MLGISRSQVRRMLANGRLKGFRVGLVFRVFPASVREIREAPIWAPPRLSQARPVPPITSGPRGPVVPWEGAAKTEKLLEDLRELARHCSSKSKAGKVTGKGRQGGQPTSR